MEELKLQTMDDFFSEITIGETVNFDTGSESYDDIFQKMETDAIEEKSRRASAYREAAKIYLTF